MGRNEKKVATEPIRCFKVVIKEEPNLFSSKYYWEPYKTGETKEVIMDEPKLSYYFGRVLMIDESINCEVLDLPVWEIERGLHSYSQEYCFCRNTCYGVDIMSKVQVQGCRLDGLIGSNLTVIDCEIPVGAKYYINEYGEIVSDKLLVVGEREIC